jgi:hypothetical protein
MRVMLDLTLRIAPLKPFIRQTLSSNSVDIQHLHIGK